MSGVVKFSDGGSWSTGRRGWNLLLDRTRQKLAERGLEQLGNEIMDYGAFFNLDPDQVRIPLAEAMRDAAVELEVECAAAEGWDTNIQGPYFGTLLESLNRELVDRSGHGSSAP